MRLDPERASISALFALATFDGSKIRIAGLGASRDRHTVGLEQAGDDADVGDVGHIAQDALGIAEQRGDHGLGDQILGPTHVDRASKRTTAVDDDRVAG